MIASLDAGLSDAELHLSEQDSDLAALIARVGPSGLAVTRREPYEALVRAIAHQQLHGKAAECILGRLLALHPGEMFPSPERLLGLSDEAFRGCGFSAGKTAAIRSICEHAAGGVVPGAEEAALLADEALIERLIAIRRNRLLSLNQAPETDYVDQEAVTRETGYARRLFADNGWPVIEAFLGGEGARILDEEGPADGFAFVTAQLAALFGSDVASAIRPLAATSWSRIASIGGAYSCALPSRSQARSR